MFVYSDEYDLGWSAHVFPTDKYRRVYEAILAGGLANDGAIFRPRKASREELLLVHEERYLDQLEALTLTPMAAMWQFEAPLDRKTLDAIYAATGGSMLAAAEAVRRREVWVNLGGGFHHAFPAHGEGFCFINDIAVAIRAVQKAGIVKNVLVVDCDLHQGNGTAGIFEKDPAVFTLSIHQEHLYPVKQRSSLDIGLDNYTGDREYLECLEAGLEQALDAGSYDLVFYLAGADPFEGDKLGSLKLTKDGLRKRETLVLNKAQERSLPVAAVLAGGYAENTQDVVDIHVEFCRQAMAANFKRRLIA